jgi:cellulose synthase/poly-beta-1,6-N-acetylglucosamine synthase-like glycosyltransferase
MCLGALLYVYLGYPIAAWVLRTARSKPVRKRDHRPRVSILIPAYNEAQHIGRTIANKLELDYPREAYEVVVVSDGSDDDTEAIVRRFQDQGVRLIRQQPRRGKTAALNLAVPECRGDIIVFSDANSIYDRGALRALMRNFADPAVGYVTGKMVYGNTGNSSVGDGCTTYMRYENFLRRCESEFGSVVGVDGGIDAVRKHLYRPMRPDQLPDFVLPLQVIAAGHRVVYEPEAILREETLGSAGDEYRMRVRVALRAFWALKDMRRLLDFRKFGLFAWQLWSHKVLRYMSFVFLAGVVLANLALLTSGGLYIAAFALQAAAYAAAFCSPRVAPQRGPGKILYIFEYFALVNLASAHAFWKFLTGRKQVVWTPRKG